MSIQMQPANTDYVVAVFKTHPTAENAVKELNKERFDIKKISIVGRDFHSEQSVLGFYTTGDRMKYWGKMGAFWGGLWGLLVGAAFLIIPGIGPVIVAGPAAAWIVGALEGAVIVGGLSALGAGLVSLGLPKEKALKYETSVKAGKFLLIAHGTKEEVETANNLLKATEAESVEAHLISPEPAYAA